MELTGHPLSHLTGHPESSPKEQERVVAINMMFCIQKVLGSTPIQEGLGRIHAGNPGQV